MESDDDDEYVNPDLGGEPGLNMDDLAMDEESSHLALTHRDLL